MLVREVRETFYMPRPLQLTTPIWAEEHAHVLENRSFNQPPLPPTTEQVNQPPLPPTTEQEDQGVLKAVPG